MYLKIRKVLQRERERDLCLATIVDKSIGTNDKFRRKVVLLKPRANGSNILDPTSSNMLDPTCWNRLFAMLDDVGWCWTMLDDVG